MSGGFRFAFSRLERRYPPRAIARAFGGSLLRCAALGLRPQRPEPALLQNLVKDQRSLFSAANRLVVVLHPSPLLAFPQTCVAAALRCPRRSRSSAALASSSQSFFLIRPVAVCIFHGKRSSRGVCMTSPEIMNSSGLYLRGRETCSRFSLSA